MSVAALRALSVGESTSLTVTLLCSLLPLILVALLIASIFWLYRQRTQRFIQQQQQLCSADTPISSLLGHMSVIPTCSPQLDIKLLDVKARGRFGTVWKAQLSDMGTTVAVKVFPLGARQSWISEQRVYSLPHVSDCPNILRFIGTESRETELWLITEYHEVGSLGDYLKSHTLSLGQLASVSLSLTSGLTFLHSDEDGKPTVAHRDMKSQNVLLRPDMSACIADFGLALILDGQSSDTFSQVCLPFTLITKLLQ